MFNSLGITDECAPRTQEKWTPVLAIASNAGPEQLERKLPPNLFPRGAVVPVRMVYFLAKGIFGEWNILKWLITSTELLVALDILLDSQ